MLRLLAILVLQITLPVLATPCVLQMQAQHFPPRFIKLETADGLLQWHGFNAELYQELANRVGCQAELLEIPWGRALQMLADGELSMMSNMSKNEERAEFALFIGPVSIERIVVVGHHSLLDKVGNLQQLSEVEGQIGLMQGVFYGDGFAREVERNTQLQQRLAYVGTSQQKLDLLLRGRIQLTFEDSLTLQQLYKDKVLDEQEFVTLFTLFETPVYLAVSQSEVPEALRNQLEQAWQQLIDDGTLAALKLRYFSSADLPTLPRS